MGKMLRADPIFIIIFWALNLLRSYVANFYGFNAIIYLINLLDPACLKNIIYFLNSEFITILRSKFLWF